MIIFIPWLGAFFYWAWQHGRAQGESEWRRARTIIADHARRAGRAAPRTVRQWLWEAWRGRGVLRRGMRGPRPGSPPGSAPPAGGPFRRIGRAIRRGRRRAGAARPASGRLGVCDNCGLPVAAPALKPQDREVGGRRERWMVCPRCMAGFQPYTADVTVTRPAPLARQVTGPPAAASLPVSAVPAPVPPGTTPAGLPAGTGAAPLPAAPPAAPGSAITGPAAGPPLAIAPPAGNMPATSDHFPAALPPASQPGALMPYQPSKPGAIARRSPAGAVRSAADSTTHGQWQQTTTAIATAVAQVPPALQAMLQALRNADASDRQRRAVIAWTDRHLQLIARAKATLAGVDAKVMPVLNAIESVGGTKEVAGIAYHRNVG